MLEDQPPVTGREGGCLSLIGGLFLGIGAGVLVPVVMFGLFASAFKGSRAGLAIAEVLDLASLAAIGYYSHRDFGNSMFAAGLVTGVSISFLLNVICGMVLISVR